MLRDVNVMKAITSIRQRSEKQADVDKLIGSFVDAGILPQLMNDNSAVLYGRRGTGKTHVLRVLASSLRGDSQNAVLYIDARTLGSTSQFSDMSIPTRERCFHLFQDILGELHEHLRNVAMARSEALEEFSSVVEDIEALGNVLIGTVRKRAVASSVKTKVAAVNENQLHFELSSHNAALGGKTGGSLAREAEETTEYAHDDRERVIFPDLHNVLGRVLRRMDLKLYILLDEWSSVPIDLQPYLAEFIKRGFIPVPEVTVKIASLEYRSSFSTRADNGYLLGFELGADMSANLDIDDYYVYDRNPDEITRIFGDVLYKHLSSEIGDYLVEKYAVADGESLVRQLFTTPETFRELVRSSEGVIRDLINIFTNAALSSQRRQRDSIDKKAVLEAARQWYEQDKVREIGDELRAVLERIVDEVIGAKKSRSFLLPRTLEKHPTIQRLFDARVLHLMRRGYADKDHPGVRYNIYSLDYGTYVDLLTTSKAPDVELHEDNGDVQGDLVVPFDDKRSIRSIVLTTDILDAA